MPPQPSTNPILSTPTQLHSGHVLCPSALGVAPSHFISFARELCQDCACLKKRGPGGTWTLVTRLPPCCLCSQLPAALTPPAPEEGMLASCPRTVKTTESGLRGNAPSVGHLGREVPHSARQAPSAEPSMLARKKSLRQAGPRFA